MAAVGVWGYQIAERGWGEGQGGEKNGEPVFMWRKSADVALQALHRLPELNAAAYGLCIRPSPVEGLGVFATCEFAEGEYIVAYAHDSSNVISWKEFVKQHGQDFRNTYSNRRTHQVICTKQNRNIINYINHTTNENPNVALGRKSLRALCRIEVGTELMLEYPERHIMWQ